MRFRELDRSRAALWAGVAIGVASMAVLGVFGFVMYVSLRDREKQLLGGGEAVAALPVVPMPNLPPSTSASRGASYATTMNTLSLSDTRVMRLFTAVGTRHWLVRIRVVQPPGSFAFVGNDASNVMLDGGWGVTIVPAGSTAPIRLRPGDILYGRGNVADVMVSMTAHEDDD